MNRIILPKNHYFLEASKDMRLVCQPLVEKIRMNMFVYSRYYHDGSCILLSNNEDWLQYHLSKGYLVPAPMPSHLLKSRLSYNIIPYDGPFSKAKHDLLQRYQCGQAVDYINKDRKYIEVACFAFWGNDQHALNVIVNNLDRFDQFLNIFKDAMKLTLDNADKHKIYLPENMMGINLQDIHELTYQPNNATKTRLTQRQMDVLFLLTRGKTAKETAIKLGLSHRTIENHLANLKVKMNVSSRSELIEKSINLLERH